MSPGVWVMILSASSTVPVVMVTTINTASDTTAAHSTTQSTVTAPLGLFQNLMRCKKNWPHPVEQNAARNFRNTENRLYYMEPGVFPTK